MLITAVTIGTSDLSALEDFHRDVLQLPVHRIDDTRIEVRVGTGTVRYERRARSVGAHHLAFSVPPEDFERAREHISARVGILPHDGSPVIAGPPGWDSRSVYFTAPDGLILEYIAHEGHRGHSMSGPVPVPLGIAEVGIGVEDVPATVRELTGRGLTPFPPQGPTFAPLGDIDGMLIVVDRHRLWFPELRDRPATDPSEIVLAQVGAPPGKICLQPAELFITD
ncbi:MAG: hypothetical protein QM677_10050 [Microbacterium sp.]